MRILPQGLESHLAQDVTTLCYYWILRRTDGVVTGYTDHDRELAIESVTCSPSTGFAAGALDQSLGLSGDTSEVAGALSDDGIADGDILAGRYDGATVEHYLVNWQNAGERVLLSRSQIGEITREGRNFRVELRSLSATLDQVRGRQYLADCDADLGDTRCGFDLTSDGYFSAATVVAVTDRQVVTLSGLDTFPDDWFVHGHIEWLSGANTGTQSLVTAARTDGDNLRVTLFEGMPVDAKPGDTLTIRAGCDKRFATCKAKFANQINFRGFPHMPGSERALNYVSDGEDFDGSPLVP